MVEEHTVFKHPDADATVWRFMSLAKYLSLLKTSQLYFARSDKLGDPLEGYMSDFAVGRATAGDPEAMRELAKERVRREDIKRQMYMSCWYLQDEESSLMWNAYTANHEGLAIRTSFKQLRLSITDRIDVYMGRITYRDYVNSAPLTAASDDFLPFLHKRSVFRSEHELRAIVRLDEVNGEGIGIDVDLSVLFGSIYVAPRSPLWFAEIVRDVTRNYGYTDVEVTSSILSEGFSL